MTPFFHFLINLLLLLLTIVDQFCNHFDLVGDLVNYLEELGHMDETFSMGSEVIKASWVFVKHLVKFGPILAFSWLKHPELT